MIADVRTHADEECSNPVHSACVAPTVCVEAPDDQRRDCILHPDRYAVIPFSGSGRVGDASPGGTDVTTDRKWEVCCGCGEPPSGPPPELIRRILAAIRGELRDLMRGGRR